MTLAEVVHSEAGTFHSFAAACTSIMRAAAPPLRTYSFDWRTPRLPPVEKSPQARLRATLWPGVGYSISTLLQSQSSSSAMSWARPVIVPWPISARTARMRVVLSGRIATHVVIDPRLLHFVQDLARGQAFDRGDLGAARRAHGDRARAHREAVHVHRAGAALRDAAAVLGAGEADLLADRPQQGRGRIDVDLVGFAVDCQAHCYSSNVVRGCGREMRIFASGYPTPIIGSR